MIRLLTLVLMIACASSTTAAEKIKLPSNTDRDKAARLVRDLFKAEFAKTTAADKLDLAKKLLQNAEETKDDPAAVYVLLKETAELIGAVDIDIALQACEQMTNKFEGDLAELIEPTLKVINAKISAP